MNNKFILQLGDPSGDGHNIHSDKVIECNKSNSEIEEAYIKSCELTGLVFAENQNIIVNGNKLKWDHPEHRDRKVCVDYETGSPSDLAVDILRSNGIEIIEDYEDNFDEDSLVDVFLNFIKLSLPDFEWNLLKRKKENTLKITIGYGLYE